MKNQDCHIKTVLFDFVGVSAEEGFRKGLEAIAITNTLEPATLIRTAYDTIYSCGYVLGKATESTYWRVLRETTGINGSDDELRKEILSRFIVRDWIIDLVKQMKNGKMQTGILSDQTNWIELLNQQYDFFRWFDVVFNSYHIGKGKRDPSLFDDVLKTLGVSADNVIFIDDDPGNCERARQKGIQVIHYTNRENLIRSLEDICPRQPHRRQR
ncbi:MAG: HAD family phosphatase [Deltaproteobacteria bacterium]|nr:HAD family phosphatase [Deltaproteobacteria bacterium]